AGIVAALPDVSRVESMTILPTGVAGPGQIPITRTYPDQGHGRVSLLAVTDGSQLFATPTLLEGRWLGTRETGSIVLNQVARNSTVPNVHAGGTVQLTVGGRPTSWRVVGVAEEKAGVSNVYVTAEGLATALGSPQRVNQLRITSDRHDEQGR